MLCVETANIGPFAPTVNPGDAHTMGMLVSVETVPLP